jgi:hypothetical protein
MTTLAAWDLVCQVLSQVYGKNKARFEREAAQMGATLEQFAAMSITQTIRNFLEGKSTNGEGTA